MSAAELRTSVYRIRICRPRLSEGEKSGKAGKTKDHLTSVSLHTFVEKKTTTTTHSFCATQLKCKPKSAKFEHCEIDT